MYSETFTVPHEAGLHNGTLDAFRHHFQPGMISLNGLDPTNYDHWDDLMAVKQGHPVEVAAHTGDPQTDRDLVHISQGFMHRGMNPWMRPGIPLDQQPVLPPERYNQAANGIRREFGLPEEGPMQMSASADVSSDMSVLSKWNVVALGELQQPGGVGATQDYNPVVDGPNPDGPDFADNAGNSPEQEVALQTWVNTAVDLLNRGTDPQEVIARLAHDGCPNPEEVLERAQQQPEHTPMSDDSMSDPLEVPNQPDPSTSGQMESLSQQPPVTTAHTKRVRIAGTTMTGTEIDRWESLWGEGTVKVALDGGGTVSVAPEAVQELTEGDFKHPVTEIQSFIDSMPKVEPTRPHIEARLANLELVRRAVRANISKVGFTDQMKLSKIDSDAEAETAVLKEILANHHEEFEVAYAKASRRFAYNAFDVATPEVTPYIGHAKEAGAIWATENFDVAITDETSFKSAAAHYAHSLGLTGSQFQEFLAGADEHRLVRTEEFTADGPEITENEGPAEALFV